MQGTAHFGLPRQRVNQLLQANGDLPIRERITARVQESDVRDDAKRVRHRDDPILNFDPVPGYSC